MFGQKYQRPDTPLLLHKKDQFPQLVLSTSLEETILYSKPIHMYTGRLQHIQGEGLGKGYIHIQHILQIHHGVYMRSVFWTAHSCAAHGSQIKMMGDNQGNSSHFFFKCLPFNKGSTYKFQQNVSFKNIIKTTGKCYIGCYFCFIYSP